MECYSVLRYLHSFPTRRSSDLGRGGERRRAGPGRGSGGRAARGAEALVVQIGKRSRALRAHLRRRRLLEEDRDRKSTRLNSSHTVISYAVFCLKKKTNRTKILI